MNALQIFLRAFENAMNTKSKHRGNYIYKVTKENAVFKAYKVLTCEVWIIDGSHKQLIAIANVTGRMINDLEEKNLYENLYQLTIEEVLGYYGFGV